MAKRHLKGYQRGAEDSEGPDDPKNLVFTESSKQNIISASQIAPTARELTHSEGISSENDILQCNRRES